MGHQASGGHFHSQLAMLVLAGLIYIICELYIDDVLIHATTEDRLFTNMSECFTRFRERRLIFNPEKVQISDTMIDFIGHEIDTDGISFPKDKRNGVADIVLPRTKGELKGFLGVANYFRDHVKNHPAKAHPLQELLAPNYTVKCRNHRIMWTPQLERAFYDLRDAVASCPKLFFVNNEWPIYLETDACDYGIGAVLYQINPITAHNSIGVYQKRKNTPSTIRSKS
jgi:hypothetical protein